MRGNNISILIQNGNDDDKQQLIVDAVEAVRGYVKKGNKNDLYNNMMTYESTINDAISEKFCAELIRENLERRMESRKKAAQQEIAAFVIEKNQDRVSDKMERFMEDFLELTSEYMAEELKNMSYLSHLHSLCQISEREEEVREEYSEFSSIKTEIPYMEKVAYEIEKKRRLPYCELASACEIDEEETKKMLHVASNYFVVSKHPEEKKRVVTLSKKGQRFLKYAAYESDVISREEAEGYVHVVSRSIFSSARSSMNCRVVCDIDVPGTSPALERKIKYEYKCFVEDLLEKQKLKESYHIYEEGFRFTKPKSLLEISIRGGNNDRIGKTNL